MRTLLVIVPLVARERFDIAREYGTLGEQEELIGREGIRVARDQQDDFGLGLGESFEPPMHPDDANDVDLTRPHIMTVLGPIVPDELGPTLIHEHLLANPPAVAETDPDLVIPDWDAALADAEAMSFAGGSAIVDATPLDNGRDLAGLRWVAERVAVKIIATTGFHKDIHCRSVIERHDPDALIEQIVRELVDGDPATGVRPGLLKVGTSLDEITPAERAAITIVGAVHRVTGVTVTTHTEAGTMALEVIDLLGNAGVVPNRILLGHMDRRFADRAYLRSVLEAGATIGFDQLSKPAFGPDEPKARVLAELIGEGYADQLVLSQDIARRSLRPSYGGKVGWSYIFDHFTLMLMDAGVPAVTVRQLLVDNPARILTIQPPAHTDTPV